MNANAISDDELLRHINKQWYRAAKILPPDMTPVRGIFRDGIECICECSAEENIWFIGAIVTDAHVWWSFVY